MIAETNAYQLVESSPEQFETYMLLVSGSEHWKALTRLLEAECDGQYRLLARVNPEDTPLIAKIQGRIEGLRLILTGPERGRLAAREEIDNQRKDDDDEPA